MRVVVLAPMGISFSKRRTVGARSQHIIEAMCAVFP
jgi:hypothetical protein